MDKCKQLQDLGVLKIAFDRKGSTTAHDEDQKLWDELSVATDQAEGARIVKRTYWFYGQTNVAIGMIDRDHWDPGTVLNVDTGAGIRSIEVQDKFWI